MFVSLATRRSPAPRSWLTSSGVASEHGSQSEDGFLAFRGPSWANPLSRRLLSEENRVRARKNGSSGASSGWSDLEPKFLLIAFRWRSDLPSRPHLPVVADRPGRLGLPSRSPIAYEPPAESRKAESARSSLWITGISGTSYARGPNLPDCPSGPSLLPRPGARILAARLRTCLSARIEPAAARGCAHDRGPGADAGRRRHRQDRRADRPARPHHRHAQSLAEPDSRRDFHQQGGARDEGACLRHLGRRY